jgi:DUF4097 and DUF4098 domain-containing protein YvlB
VRTGFGNTDIRGVQEKGGPTGIDVYVKTSFGEVSMEQIGGSLQVEYFNGNISVKEVKGKAEFNTSFGS